jgi:hypothetical protein
MIGKGGFEGDSQVIEAKVSVKTVPSATPGRDVNT